MFEEIIGNSPTLSSALINYEMAKETKSKLEAALKDAAREVAELEDEAIALMLEQAECTGADGLTVMVNARKYSVTQKDYWSIPATAREEVFPRLRGMGLDYLIQERVDDRSLTNYINGVLEEPVNAGEMPEELAVLPLSRYTKTSLSSRRTT